MSYSRSGSRGSFESWIANRPKAFRTIHRNRSNHEPILLKDNIKRIDRGDQLNTESRLQKFLSLSPQKSDHPRLASCMSSGRQSQFNKESHLLSRSRVVESSLTTKNDTKINNKGQSQLSSKLINEKKRQITPRLGERLISSMTHMSHYNQTKRSKFIEPEQNIDFQTLQNRLNELINKKLQLLNENAPYLQNMKRTGFTLQNGQIDKEIKDLVQKISKMKTSKQLSGKEDTIINKKIELIQNLLAQNFTELSLLRKRYFGTTARKNKTLEINSNKIKLTSECLHFFQKQRKQPILKTEPTPSKGHRHWYFNQKTTNKNDFRVPNPEDYESFRFQPKAPSLNRQPLPRSSYKRDYLTMKSEPTEKIVAKENGEIFPKFFRDMASIYSKQYKQHKAQLVNHKQMDACRDKLKFINFSYAPKKKGDALMRIKENNRKKQAQSAFLQKLPMVIKTTPISASETEPKLGKAMFVSQARRQFIWGSNSQKSKIKHQHLKQFQYRLKNLFKA